MIVARINTQPFAGTQEDLLNLTRHIASQEAGKVWPSSNRQAKAIGRKLTPLIEVEQGEVDIGKVRQVYTETLMQAMDEDDTEAANAALEL